MKVLKFGAVWCPGCLVMKPRWEDIEKENPWLQTEYYDFDSSKELIEDYKIQTLPTSIFLDKENKEFLRLEGEIKKEKILDAINENKNR